MTPPMPIPIIDRNPLAAAACGRYGVVRHSPRHPAVHPRPRGGGPGRSAGSVRVETPPIRGAVTRNHVPRRKASQAGGLVGVIKSGFHGVGAL
jgi:hypothetical protein